MKKTKWIKRALVNNPYCVGLCLGEKAFHRELKRLKVPKKEWPCWITEGKDACVHELVKTDKNERCLIVCMKKLRKAHTIESVGLLIHEAVHVWQTAMRNMNETYPGDEIEAYSIQQIAQGLIDAYGK